MLAAEIVRYETGDHGTFGVLLVGDFGCHTLELPWRGNRRNVSCIPPGAYPAEMAETAHFPGYCYRLAGVPNRSGILIHVGNIAGDTNKGLQSESKGCILVGLRRGKLGDQHAVLNSKAAIWELYRASLFKPLEITIREEFDDG